LDRGRPSFPHDCSCRVVLEIPAAGRLKGGTGLSPAMVRHPRRFPHPNWHCWWADRPTGRSHNPDAATTVTLTRHRFRQEPVSLATTPGAIVFPPATEMFQFTGCPLPSRECHAMAWRVAPFGNDGIDAWLPLPHPVAAAQRPSSAGRAEASPDRASCLAWSPGSSATRV
jgi:hypothetical protein